MYDFGPTAVSRLGQYLELTTEVVRLIFTSQPELISVELCSQIIRCFICSVAMERGWIPFSCEYQEFMRSSIYFFLNSVRLGVGLHVTRKNP